MTLFFQEPFDFAAIDRCLADWECFGATAYACMGLRENWNGSVEQLARLFDVFEREGKDTEPLYKLFDLLAERAEAFADTADARQWMLDVLCPDPLLRLSFAHRLEFIHKVDKQWHQREQNKRWLEAHRLHAEAMRKPAADAPLVASASLATVIKEQAAARARKES